MSSPAAHGLGDWMSLLDGVRVSRRWMTRHTPQLLTAWCDAPTDEHRRAIAARILQIAADMESEPDDADDMAAESAWRAFVVQIDANRLAQKGASIGGGQHGIRGHAVDQYDPRFAVAQALFDHLAGQAGR